MSFLLNSSQKSLRVSCALTETLRHTARRASLAVHLPRCSFTDAATPPSTQARTDSRQTGRKSPCPAHATVSMPSTSQHGPQDRFQPSRGCTPGWRESRGVLGSRGPKTQAAETFLKTGQAVSCQCAMTQRRDRVRHLRMGAGS